MVKHVSLESVSIRDDLKLGFRRIWPCKEFLK